MKAELERSKPLVMVVEDNVVLLEGLRDLLEIAGYRVVTATNGKKGLDLLEQHKPDLIISDIMMPTIDGYEFHSQVRKRPDLLGVPFIFLTARGEKSDIRRGKELGVDDYITKPFDEEDLLVVVRAKLARWEGLRRVQDEEMAELKRKLLLSLSHEFRTPLSYIFNYAEILEMEGESISSEDFSQFMHGIRKGAGRLNRLVEDFIRLVELQTGEAERAYLNRREEIPDTGAWLRVVVRTHQEAATMRGLRLILEVPDGLPALVADEAYLADAIGRLVENAIKFSKPESGWIRVRARAKNGVLYIRVEDNGVGIREREMASLFNVFQQIDRAKQEQQGTGSGLAICKGIVELHGGKVTAESEYGVGSAFTIMLPLRK